MAIGAAERGTVSAAALLADASHRLAEAGIDSARLDAELLLAASASVSRESVVMARLVPDPKILARFEALLARRLAREPLAYIVGRKEFYSLEFEVTPAVLIPRPETETLVAASLRTLELNSPSRVLDLGTGSGAIAIAITANAPEAHVVATDISAAALEVAKRNAMRIGVASRVEFRRADLFGPLDGGSTLGRFDLIVSNPPYVEEGAEASLAPEIREYEPRLATISGPDGLRFYRRIAADAVAHLAESGVLMVEIGAGQAAAVASLFSGAGMQVFDVLNDLAGIERVVVARRRAEGGT